MAPVVNALLHKSHEISYFLCKKIDPSGNYFHMVVENHLPNDSIVDVELHVPHHYIRGAFHAADLKRLGFTAP